MIEVKNLVKRYGDHYAVNHLSFTVEDGQIFGFLGPNGAGKSTTMNIMTGYLAATEGQVLVEGHDILEEPEAARACIGYLPEIPPLYPDMTVEEYLRFCAELKKIPKEQRTDQLTKVLALTHLEDMSARLIRNLSKGYRQRVGLVGFLPSTAVGSLLGFFVVLILVCFLINALSNNWKVTAGVLVAGAAVLIAFYLRDSSVFANLLPDVLGKFSLLSAFDSFSTDHVFDVPGILLYLSISALLVFLTVQVIQKRRWN